MMFGTSEMFTYHEDSQLEFVKYYFVQLKFVYYDLVLQARLGPVGWDLSH